MSKESKKFLKNQRIAIDTEFAVYDENGKYWGNCRLTKLLDQYLQESQSDAVEAIKLLEEAKCPNCRGDGVEVYMPPMGSDEHNPVISQCQWCAERDSLIAKWKEEQK